MAIRCVLDCDPGHDDAIAIIAAVAAPQLDLRAITTVAGNGTIEQTTINARKVAALIGADVPIAAGAATPLRGDLVTAHDIHGETALDGPELTAQAPLDPRSAQTLLSDVLTAGDELTTVIATGPLTNVAQLLADNPAAASRIERIVLMGGSTDRGNTTPAAEFNIFVDPEAAAAVFESGIPVQMTGLNLTHQAIAGPEIRARVAGVDTAVAHAVGGWLDFFADTYRARFGFAGPPIHDACAVAWTALPDVVESTAAFVAVELDGTWTRGATVVDLNARLGHPPNTEVGITLVQEPFWDFIIGALAPLNRQRSVNAIADPERPCVYGGCLCGGVRYEIRGPFRRANFCHCSRCRKHSGAAASAQGRVPQTAFTLLQGHDLLVSFSEPGHMTKVFCSRCGSSLFGGTWPAGSEVSVRLGTLDDDPLIRPGYHSFVDDVPAWDRIPDDGLARYARRPPRGVA